MNQFITNCSSIVYKVWKSNISGQGRPRMTRAVLNVLFYILQMDLTRRFTISLPDANEGYCNLDQPRTTVDPYAITSDQPETTVDPYAAGAVTTTCRPMILSCFIFIVTIYINV